MPTMDELYQQQQKAGPQPRPKHAHTKRTPVEHEAKLVGMMRQAYGIGPNGATCGACAHLYTVQYAGTYHKCGLGPQSKASTTDWRKRWQACGKFQAKQAQHG